ncbi:MAG: hypothetical protein MZW92_09645 [Comamonadaceae bacterium]|nr:hypothetical protein [Comamonadaceae bacterium]
MSLIIVSGLSGSGKTIALQALEDLGFYCIDNLPASLLPHFADTAAADVRAAPCAERRRSASTRATARFSHALPESLARLESRGVAPRIDLSRGRRRHPGQTLQGNPSPPPADRPDRRRCSRRIRIERRLLEPLAFDRGDPHRHHPRHAARAAHRGSRTSRAATRPAGVTLLFQSFGFKHGVPLDADYVFDVRCLPNPHWQTGAAPADRARPAGGRIP